MSSRSWLFITIPVAVLAVSLLAITAQRLVRAVRSAVVASVPLAAVQRVTFGDERALVLNLAGSRFARGPSGLSFMLNRADDGRSAGLTPVVARTRTSGTSQVRVALYDVLLAGPGDYVLRIDGLDAAREGSVLFTRPIGSRLVGYILALVVLGAAFIGALVVSGLVVARTAITR